MSKVRASIMKSIVAALITLTIANTAVADSILQHPLFVDWTWTRKVNNCTEVYSYQSDHTLKVTSGEEIGESLFTISDEPDKNGFYRLTDEVTKNNGLTGCDGTGGGTPVGDKATNYVFIRPAGDQMVICQESSFSACFGPLKRIIK